MQEGFLSFWLGYRAVVMGCIPAHAGYFSVYEYSKRWFGIKHDNSFYLFSTFATGAAASFLHDFFMTPMEVVKQRT
jgi:solute carrier family 25 iron transporter 28/37